MVYTSDIFTLKEMMTILHIGKDKALQLIHENLIPGHKVANKWIVFAEDVYEYVRHC